MENFIILGDTLLLEFISRNGLRKSTPFVDIENLLGDIL